MCNLVLIEEMENVNTHSDVVEERVAGSHNLLLGITVGVVYDMLWFLCTRNGESILDHDLLLR